MAAHILIVEDEEALSELASYNLKSEGYKVSVAFDGDEALLCLEEETPDLVLLDWMLPNVSGIEICRRIRQRPATKNLPIIMMTAKAEEYDKIRGLDIGADDYITKPFSIPELLARVRALLRRSKPSLIEMHLTLGSLTLERDTYKVSRAGKAIHLGPTEFRLLTFLMENPRRVFERDQLLSAVWDKDSFIETRTVDVHIGRLRKALNKDFENDPVRTIRSAGYTFDPDQL